jgi:hypothetical protein
VLQCERTILIDLEYRLCVPTSACFMDVYLAQYDVQQHATIAYDLLEASLLDLGLLRTHLPSLIAWAVFKCLGPL